MSWIEQIETTNAEGELRVVYDELTKHRGKVANILKVHSLRPAALRAHLRLYMDLMFAGSGLSRRQRELLAVVVSRENRCAYCVAHHREALAHYVPDDAWLDALANGGEATLAPVEQALADYAVKLTRNPGAMREDDVAALRETGFADADILLVNLIVAYFNFVNRIALGLGVSFDADELRGYANTSVERP